MNNIHGLGYRTEITTRKVFVAVVVAVAAALAESVAVAAVAKPVAVPVCSGSSRSADAFKTFTALALLFRSTE